MALPPKEKERVLFGIPGLDEMMCGGLIKNSTCTIIGTYGTGKTTFALQYLFEGIEKGEIGVYISLEENEQKIYEKIGDRGWDIEPYAGKSLFVIKLDANDFNLSINSIKNDLPELIKDIGAQRVVIDPISLFEGLFNDIPTRRREMFRFMEMMTNLNCTTLLTSEMSSNDAYASKYGLVEYLADTVIFLRYIRTNEMTEAHTGVEVIKMRRSNHSREIKPYEIQEDRVKVYSEASVF